jgi:hypothetical protein
MFVKVYIKRLWFCTIILSLVAFFSFTSVASADNELLVGYAQLDITPKFGTGMPGYFHGRKADGVLDPLLIKALTLTYNDTTLVILAIDLIAFDRSLVGKLRDAVKSKTGIPPERVFIHTTHTHTGARVFEIADRLPQQIASVTVKALESRKQEVSVTLGCAEEHSVTFIRRYLMKDGTVRTNPGRINPNIVRPIGRVDPKVNVLTFHTTRTSLVSHGLHCDCVGGSKFSADYPYHLTETIRQELGADWNVVYLNACSGNINHINVNDKSQRSSYEESRKIGKVLAKAALRAYKRSAEVKIDRLDSRVKQIRCPIRKVPRELYEWAKVEMREDSDKASKRNFNEFTPRGIIRLAETKEQSRIAEVIVLSIGPVGIVGLPAECFVELSRDIQTHSLMDSTWVIGLTGGSMGYVPHSRGYREGGYEATYSSAPLSPETPMLWCDAAISMLNELRTKEHSK